MDAKITTLIAENNEVKEKFKVAQKYILEKV